MKGAIVHKPDSKALAVEVIDFLKSSGFDVRMTDEDLERYDFIVVVGGDGTILRVLQKLRECPPIFAINTGRIGLLTHCEPQDYKERLLTSLRNFDVEEFMRLKCRVGDVEVLALNEIAILCSIPAKLVEMKIYVDDVLVDVIRCDGILVSTPVGSTAYSLSIGGPIIDPYLGSILIIPVAPFKLGWKPWVVRDDRIVRIEFDRSVFVVADGQETIRLDPGEVTIEKSEHPARFFKVENRIERIVERLKRIS